MKTSQIKKFCILFCLLLCLSGISAAAGSKENEPARIFWPPPPASPRIFFVKNIPDHSVRNPSFWSRVGNLFSGKGRWSLNRPMDIDVAEDGALYIADTGQGEVIVYHPKTQRLKRIKQINKKESLIAPIDVAISEGILFICDVELKKVFALDAKGKVLFVLGEKEGILRPMGLFAKDHKLYIVDTAGSKIIVVDFQGKVLLTFGGPGKGDGQFNHPTYICVGRDHKIYVSDTLNFRIQIFDPSGAYIKSIGKAGDGTGSFTRPKGLASDSFGHIYVVDAVFDNVQIFDENKNFLLNFGTGGSSDGEFWLPAGVDIDKENFIYIADSYNQRISVFQYAGGDE
ncbi:MAG: 6-bladed beta-propeller [Candidatus Omnitrophica bacterium]|nr:6-bladed beta-propeller [Candidatus Omnitrophota bacterium]